MKGETDLRSLGTGWKEVFKRMNGGEGGDLRKSNGINRNSQGRDANEPFVCFF